MIVRVYTVGRTIGEDKLVSNCDLHTACRNHGLSMAEVKQQFIGRTKVHIGRFRIEKAA